jgi:hypothetical protein
MKTYRNTLENAPVPQPITVDVLYTTSGGRINNCTNGGVTGLHERVILVPLGATTPDPVLARLPILKVVSRNIGGKTYLHAEPIDKCPSNRVGYMAGGNFVYTSDSRYRQFVCEYPISVHDRSETQAQNDLLSR